MGAPPSRMRRVRRRVSTPVIPTSPCTLSQASRCDRAREIRRVRNRRFQDNAARGWGQGFDILIVGPDVSDVGKGKGDDLTGIGGVSDDFLVPGQGGVEADFSDGGPGGADTVTPENPSRPPAPKLLTPPRYGMGRQSSQVWPSMWVDRDRRVSGLRMRELEHRGGEVLGRSVLLDRARKAAR